MHASWLVFLPVALGSALTSVPSIIWKCSLSCNQLLNASAAMSTSAASIPVLGEASSRKLSRIVRKRALPRGYQPVLSVHRESQPSMEVRTLHGGMPTRGYSERPSVANRDRRNQVSRWFQRDIGTDATAHIVSTLPSPTPVSWCVFCDWSRTVHRRICSHELVAHAESRSNTPS